LVTLLGQDGHRLLQATDGAEAITTIKAERPDLVITDILLATMDVCEFIRRIRIESSFENTPVIFYAAAYHEREARALAEVCGVRHVMSKPSLPEAILRVVGESLGLLPPPVPTQREEASDRDHERLLSDRLATKVDELEAVAGKLSRLVEVSQQLALEPGPTRLVERYCAAAREIIGARHAAVGILAAGGGTFDPYCLCGGNAGKGSAPDVKAELFQTIIQERRALRKTDLSEGSLSVGLPPIHPPQGSFLGVPIISGGELYGILYLLGRFGETPFSDADERLAASLAAKLGSGYRNALQNEQLKEANRLLGRAVARRKRAEEKVQESATSLRVLSRRLMDAQESERRSIARELHDEIGQALSTLRLNLHVLQKPRSAEEKASCISDSVGLVEKTLQQVRDMSLNLRPSILDDLGLVSALEWQMNKLAERAGFRGQVQTAGLSGRLPAALETICFRVAQEALTNVVRHAQARRVVVGVRQDDQHLLLTVRDDGVGFDVKAAATRAREGGCMGLLGMKERVLLGSGEFRLRSGPGRGTRVRVRFPLVDASRAAGNKGAAA
jgi:signal transduction histidine kinase